MSIFTLSSLSLIAMVFALSCGQCPPSEEIPPTQPNGGTIGAGATTNQSNGGNQIFGFNDNTPWCTGDGIGEVMLDSEGRVYATPGAGLGISVDGGRSFDNATTSNGLPSMGVQGLYLGSDNAIYTGHHSSNGCGGNGCPMPELYVAVSHDRGNTFTKHRLWRKRSFDTVVDITVVDEAIIAAVNGPSGGIYVKTANNEEWELRGVPRKNFPTNAISQMVQHAGTIYVATVDGLAISHDVGKTYKVVTEMDGLHSRNLFTVFADHDIILVGNQNGISLSKDGGVNWSFRGVAEGLPAAPHSQFSTTSSPIVNSIHRDHTGRIWLAMKRHLVFSDDLGDTFRESPLPAPLSIRHVAFNNDEIYLATDYGLMISRDRGRNYENFNHNHGLGAYHIEQINGQDHVSLDYTAGEFPN